jgi:predicted nucleotide-binding protein (sugar kinase/HSP70/actin superfamily)
MATKELVKAEIETLTDEQINKLYGIIQDLKTPKEGEKSLMEKLRSISIDAPEDFAENFDAYASGEKRLE